MKRVMKTNAAEKDMTVINGFAKRELSADEVYTFEVMAADTQIDRDGEYFTPQTLADLAKLYIGKTMIADHNPKADNQTARIYHAYTRQDGDITRLMVQAYMLKSGNEALIDKIEAGIIREVSIGCAIRQKTCSFCGKAFDRCRHEKGKIYDGVTCAVALDGAAGAYDISFVAVPAQREAGVVKCKKSFSDEADEANQQQEQVALQLRLAAAQINLKEFDNYGNE